MNKGACDATAEIYPHLGHYLDVLASKMHEASLSLLPLRALFGIKNSNSNTGSGIKKAEYRRSGRLTPAEQRGALDIPCALVSSGGIGSAGTTSRNSSGSRCHQRGEHVEEGVVGGREKG